MVTNWREGSLHCSPGVIHGIHNPLHAHSSGDKLRWCVQQIHGAVGALLVDNPRMFLKILVLAVQFTLPVINCKCHPTEVQCLIWRFPLHCALS